MPYTPMNFVVWTEIPVSDLDKGIAFYSDVLGIEVKKNDDGPNPIAMFPTWDDTGVAGHLYVGKPAKDASGPTIHFASPGKLEDTVAKVAPAGGKVVSDPIEIPPGRFTYCQDPDGNSFSIFEAKQE